MERFKAGVFQGTLCRDCQRAERQNRRQKLGVEKADSVGVVNDLRLSLRSTVTGLMK